MKNKNRLNCYIFSNFIVSIICLHYILNDGKELISVSNNLVDTKSVAHLMTNEKEEVYTNNEMMISDTTTISVSNTVLSSANYTYTSTYVKPSYDSVTGNNVVNYAKNYLGLRYVSGGNSLVTGTDCSGFTKLIYGEFGISLGRTVGSQMYAGSYVAKGDLQPGDLIFYGYNGYASHVAIYMGNGTIIHQSTPKSGVKTDTMHIMVYITARRIIKANTVTNTTNNDNTNKITEKEDIPSIKPTENIKEETKGITDNNSSNTVNDNKENTKNITDNNSNDSNSIPNNETDNIKQEEIKIENNNTTNEKTTENKETTVEIKEESSLESEKKTNDVIVTSKEELITNSSDSLE